MIANVIILRSYPRTHDNCFCEGAGMKYLSNHIIICFQISKTMVVDISSFCCRSTNKLVFDLIAASVIHGPCANLSLIDYNAVFISLNNKCVPTKNKYFWTKFILIIFSYGINIFVQPYIFSLSIRYICQAPTNVGVAWYILSLYLIAKSIIDQLPVDQ